MPKAVAPYHLKMNAPVMRETSPTFEYNLTPRAHMYRRSIRRKGGFWQGSFQYQGTRSELESFFYSFLGFNVEERSSGIVTWEGLIFEMDLKIAGAIIRRSLDTVANRVRAFYTDHEDVVRESAWVEVVNSQNNYGRKEETLFLESQTEDSALAQRDRFLKLNAYPYPRTLGTIPFNQDAELSVRICGYVFTCNFRFLSQTSELDSEQGTLSYTDEGGDETFTDDGQAFGDWATTSGDARYSLWVTNDDDSVSWGYLGATVSGTEIRVFTDQARTTPGWNGTDPTGKTPAAYVVRGPASEWISDIVSNDCDYVSAGGVADNLLQVRRDVKVPHVRAWEQLDEIGEMGDAAGNIYSLGVDAGRILNYQLVDFEPAYFYRNGQIYHAVHGKTPVNPYLVRPLVARNVSYLGRSQELGSAFQDQRDFLIDEVEVGARSGLMLKTGEFDESELYAGRMEYLEWLSDPLDLDER